MPLVEGQTGPDRQATPMPVNGTLRDRSVLFNPERFWNVPAGGGGGVDNATDGTGSVDTSNAIGSLAEILGPTPAEREARERRALEHKGKMSAWAGLFDGLRLLGNLYYTAHGATPQVYGDVYGQIDRQYEAARQRQDMTENYRRQYALQKYQLERQSRMDDMQERRLTRQEEETRIRQEKAQAYSNYQNALVEKNEAQAAYWQAKAQALENGLPLDEAIKKATAAQKYAQARLANTKASQGGFAPKQGQEGTETIVTEGYDEHDNRVKKTVRRPIGGNNAAPWVRQGGSGGGGNNAAPWVRQ